MPEKRNSFFKTHSIPKPDEYEFKTDIEEFNKKIIDAKYAFVFEQKDDVPEKASIALVQCFYGTDIARITACYKAVKHLLKSTPFPKEWVFVEA